AQFSFTGGGTDSGDDYFAQGLGVGAQLDRKSRYSHGFKLFSFISNSTDDQDGITGNINFEATVHIGAGTCLSSFDADGGGRDGSAGGVDNFTCDFLCLSLYAKCK